MTPARNWFAFCATPVRDTDAAVDRLELQRMYLERIEDELSRRSGFAFWGWGELNQAGSVSRHQDGKRE
jgi:hypothetical protein